MTVIQRHGNTKPTADDLEVFQFGYDTRDNVYGKHEGKTLYINDKGIIRDVTAAYLKEEFVNYCLPCDADGNVVENGETVYSESAKPINGLLENLTSRTTKIFDDVGNEMGEKVTIGAYTVNPKTHQFTKPSVGALSFYAVHPEYIQKLKNSLEQKAIVSVDSYAAMVAKAEEMAQSEKKTLEAGVQFIVKHDESIDPESGNSHNGDTWLYVVINYEGEVSTEETEVEEHPTLGAGTDVHVITSYNGQTYALQPIMALEYLFHDPIAKDFRDTGFTVEIGEKNEEENTIEIGINRFTEDTIICAHDNAFSSKTEVLGVKADEVTDAAEHTDIPEIVTQARERGQTYTNYVKLYQKNFTPNGEDGPETVRQVINFNDFVLDEGSWD